MKRNHYIGTIDIHEIVKYLSMELSNIMDRIVKLWKETMFNIAKVNDEKIYLRLVSKMRIP